jgi:CelD/BcsL family acetyltransferase involved in cellulose biosynthesis
MPLSLHIGTEASDFTTLAPEWNRLLEAIGSTDPTQAPLWAATWWQVFGSEQGRRLKLGAFRDRDGNLVGIAPLLSRVHRYRVIPFRRLECIASGEPEQHEIHSEFLGLSAAPDRNTDVAVKFVEEMVAGRFGPWDEFLYPRVRRASPLTRDIATAFRTRGYDVEELEISLSRYIPLPDSFEAYVQKLSPSRRQWLRRTLRQYEKWAGAAPVLKRATDARSLARGREILVSLHQQSWQARGKPGAFSSPYFRRFHDVVMPALFERGALDLFWIEAHGRPIAALYNILWNGRVHFYQSGRSLELPPRLRPGIVIHSLAIRDAIARGLSEYDFLAGDADYKKSMALASRDLVTLRIVRANSPRERTRRALLKTVRTARKLTRR